MMEKMQRVIICLFPFANAVIALIIANRFNVFEYFPFVPKDHAYEICFTVYFTIIDIFLDNLIKFIKENFFSRLDVIIYNSKIMKDIDKDTILEFNNDDISEANIYIKIVGKKKHFKNIDLIIKKPSFAEIQNTYKSSEVTVTRDDYSINLSKLFGNCDTFDGMRTFKIAMIQDPIDGDATILLCPELSRKTFNLRYKHNNAQLKAVKR